MMKIDNFPLSKNKSIVFFCKISRYSGVKMTIQYTSKKEDNKFEHKKRSSGARENSH